MKLKFCFFVLSVMLLGCSSNDDENQEIIPITDSMNLTIDDVSIDLIPSDSIRYSNVTVIKKGESITVSVHHGIAGTDASYFLSLVFLSNGKFLTGGLNFNSLNLNNPQYKSFKHFPSNYVRTDNFVIDEVAQRVKISFSGKLYFNEENLSSDAREIKGELDLPYRNDGTDLMPLSFRGVEQYCRANLNSVPWQAKFEHRASSFTAEDPYKIEINFANSPTPGFYSFTSQSTSNYVRFSKYNTFTQSYDYYDVTGQVGYTYREFHGGNSYSFIGSFSFVATNPNNPSDVINVTDGIFRSYQGF